MSEPTAPSKVRKVNPPLKLLPPIQVIQREQQKKFEGRMKNPIYKFCFIFFGEGF